MRWLISQGFAHEPFWNNDFTDVIPEYKPGAWRNATCNMLQNACTHPTVARETLPGERKTMPALQIRALPQDVYDLLAETAKRQYRSITQQAIVSLREGLFKVDAPSYAAQPDADLLAPTQRAAQREAILARIQAMEKPKIPKGFPSPAELVRADRDSR